MLDQVTHLVRIPLVSSERCTIKFEGKGRVEKGYIYRDVSVLRGMTITM